MAGWTSLKGLLKEEIKQRMEEGCDVTGFPERFEQAGDDEAKLNALYDEIMTLEPTADFKYYEPSGLEEIRAARPAQTVVLKSADGIDEDRFYGALLGRCCGCALGKPVETGHFMGGKDGVPGWKLVYEWFKQAGAYPIKGYTPIESPAAEQYGIEARCYPSTREHIAFMESDDDIRYTVLGIDLMRSRGLDWNTMDVGNLWLGKLPYHMVCTAEKQAYLNLAYALDMIREDKSPEALERALEYTRMYRNPYREWIGAQIRVDGYAYAAAGNPELAAELAWRDASLSHVKNGIYGAMFCAAMIAAAFVESDPEKIVLAGLEQIPANCRLSEDLRKAIEIAHTASDELELVETLWKHFDHYDPVHTNNNAALCAAALIYAKGDYEKAITIAVLGGWDTDCNGATVGSVMGAALGTAGIGKNWSEPLHDQLYSQIPDYHPISIRECAHFSYEQYCAIRETKK
ncbi:MAG: ADP-ribosylglycohydrolase family protein [Clostridia bacterium]|nr:ADP-ribosylglycohydrolase family protein [Clostridia bacterium]